MNPNMGMNNMNANMSGNMNAGMNASMNPNINPNMNASINAMGGSISGAPMPMMNNGVMNPQMAAAAAAARQQHLDSQRGILNTYIYEYFIRYGMFDCARSLLSSDQQINVSKDGTKAGNGANGEGSMDNESKDDLEAKLPDDLPAPKLPTTAVSDTSFLYEWFCLFWDIYNAQRVKGGNGAVNQYVAHTQHTQQQNRLKQSQAQQAQHTQDLLRQMRPEMAAQQQYQAQMLRMQQNGNMNMNMNMNMKQGNLARAAMANNHNNPQMMMQHAKQSQMQREASAMEQTRERPSSPSSGDNAPSPSKRPRLDGAFHPTQPSGMIANGRPVQGMHGQQIQPNPSMATAAHQLLNNHGIDPRGLSSQQLHNFINAPPSAQQKSVVAYSQNLQQHHGSQMGNKQVSNAVPQQNHGSPMIAQGPDGTALSAYYNPDGQMAGPGGIRPGQAGAQAAPGSNHALQDYQMQLMLLEQQNKKRLMMARQEQDTITGIPREGGGPGAPGQPGPNGQFSEMSPQAMRSGASPIPSDQIKRGTPQMHNSGIPASPAPEGGQSRDSPNPAMNFMGSQVDPSMAPHFFKSTGEGPMTAQGPMGAHMNGMRPPNSIPGQPFNGPMNTQQMLAARQMQQGQGQPGQQPGGQGGPSQWQQGPNGQGPQGIPQNQQQIHGTPQQRSMPPPSAPIMAASNANSRTTASPQQPVVPAPPTPSQATKAAPKKKETKAAKEKRAAAAAKKASQNASNNAGATPVGDNAGDAATTPVAPATPVNATFNKNAQNGGAGQSAAGNSAPAATAAASAPRTSSVPPQAHDPSQNGLMDSNFGMMEFPGIELANPLHTGDVLNDFDFDSFLHDNDGANEPFDFNGTFPGMESNEIGAD
ncbi:hypothetical protein E4U57_006039 [Claviceps arundinis]|uniref:LisH domain-containing protein n=1 Tax=Claviceps arundinis TaxID=1623583 RepID=A0A9P7MPC0_9HYPO|nr:hypothetical protein E4U56_003762 [Claviceps arundinis]KAG5968489.1 hypothetical protein E4U57_006039 [Claviceps arundinis]